MKTLFSWLRTKFLIYILFLTVNNSSPSRILGYFPVPSISHQVVFRQLIYELAKRGHTLVTITPDPAFFEDGIGKNITEINVHDDSYNFWRNEVVPRIKLESSSYDILTMFMSRFPDIVEIQLQHKDVQDLIKGKEKFDLLLIEACVPSALIMSHIFKAPVVQVSSLGSVYPNLEVIGSPTNTLLYPEMVSVKLYSNSFWEKLENIWHDMKIRLFLFNLQTKDNSIFKKVFGDNAPTVSELQKKVDMLFLYTYPMWDGNRPTPPGLVYIGGLYKKAHEKLPKDLSEYLNSSTNGVLYMSLGTNIRPSLLPPNVQHVLMKVFSKLPYNVILKWDTNEINGKPKNVLVSQWLPQPELLKHPNIKLFITQGGLQSTEDAISAAVPLIALPVSGDQWYNAEKYRHFKIGHKLDIASLTEESFENAITSVIEDQSYRDNIKKLRALMLDQPESPAERAVWWVEYMLRHGGARHLRSPLADATWTEYYMLDVVGVLLAAAVILIVMSIVVLKKLVREICKCVLHQKIQCNQKISSKVKNE